MLDDAKAQAAELINEIKAVMPPNSLVVHRLEQNFEKLTVELDELRTIRAHALSGCELEANWQAKVSLTARELDVLGAIARAGLAGITHAGIMDVAYQGATRHSGNALVQIWNIRQKFKAANLADPIETLRGRGYRISTFPRTDAEMGKVA